MQMQNVTKLNSKTKMVSMPDQRYERAGDEAIQVENVAGPTTVQNNPDSDQSERVTSLRSLFRIISRQNGFLVDGKRYVLEMSSHEIDSLISHESISNPSSPD